MDPEGPTIGSQETQLVVASPPSPQGEAVDDGGDQPPPPPELGPSSVVSETELPPPPESEPPSPPPSEPSFEIPQPPDTTDFDSMPPPPPPDDDEDSSEDDFEHVVASPMPPTPELLQAPDMTENVLELPPEAPQEVEEEAEETTDVVKVKDDPAFAKYFKMRQLGMPDGAILQKIMLDGVRPDLLEYVLPQCAIFPLPYLTLIVWIRRVHHQTSIRNRHAFNIVNCIKISCRKKFCFFTWHVSFRNARH